MKQIRTLLTFLIVIAALANALPAYASPIGFRLRVENLNTKEGIVVSDNGINDADPVVGQLRIDPGLFAVSFSAASSSVVGSEARLLLVYLTFGAAASIQITLENDGFDSSVDGPTATFAMVRSTLFAPAGSFGTAQTYVNPNNLVPDLGPDTVGPLSGTVSPPAGSIAIFDTTPVFGLGQFQVGDSDGSFSKAGPFSMFSQATLNFTGPGDARLEIQTAADPIPTPEPSSIALIGVGLALAGFLKKAILNQVGQI